MRKWVDEYQNNARFGLKGKVIIEEQSNYQKITIIESKLYGNALLLDNCWMTAEGQEKQYHESLVHPALCSSKEIKKALIIGGGDGGSARECMKYDILDCVDLVEIDSRVIELSKQYLPKIGGDAWKDNRLNIFIENGIEWVKNTPIDFYDVIIIDSSDPKGPAKGLFSKEFFTNCRRILKPGGVLATQSESPETFREFHINTVKMLREIFDYADPLYGNVPIYPSGWWSWTFASQGKPRYHKPIIERMQKITESCEIWSPRWQEGAFNSIPAFLERELNL
ncbi:MULTISPECIES: polyamine aminopropyltransferase [Prochlorococcus]|uniref:polyamine aminopropyltransferase n=1 Tax=Prochlorococcus TaxID=1218 RepID=UPI00055B838C|nr:MULTISPECIES: polyamine aminopropyltransferase [Prochlorococcus]